MKCISLLLLVLAGFEYAEPQASDRQRKSPWSGSVVLAVGLPHSAPIQKFTYSDIRSATILSPVPAVGSLTFVMGTDTFGKTPSWLVFRRVDSTMTCP